ncbi:hypothetical protein H2248_008146 [Termitomyces sp. 'cryptogamus']|nr:hypothetical protein H2248_008146 [Termitomyces sp. 'cryptogamus']
MVMLNIVNPIGAGVKVYGSVADAWRSLRVLHDAKTDLGLLHAEEELLLIRYANSTNIEAHFKAMQTAWARENDQGAGINDRQFHTYLIKSMPVLWVAVTGSLLHEGMSAEVIVWLTTHALLLHSASTVAPLSQPRPWLLRLKVKESPLSLAQTQIVDKLGIPQTSVFKREEGLRQYLDQWRGQGGAPAAVQPVIPGVNNSATLTTPDPQANSVVALASSTQCLAFATLTHAANSTCQVTYMDLTASRHFLTYHEDFEMYHKPEAAARTGVMAKSTFWILGCSKVCMDQAWE